jgi:hypothetical protein
MSIKANEVSNNALLSHAHCVDVELSALDGIECIGFQFKVSFYFITNTWTKLANILRKLKLHRQQKLLFKIKSFHVVCCV